MDFNVQPAPFLWIEEGDGQVPTPRTRRYIKKKKEFVGWGSRQLIEFLESLGVQTAEKMSQHEIANMINQYVNERKLFHPEKKKKVMCDERLNALFGRKSVNKNKIADLLEGHLAENQVASDDDLFYSSEDREVDASSLSKRQKVASLDRNTVPKKKVVEVSKSALAAISSENIKLVYLKRTLVLELLKDQEKFESKVLGSFVRIKSDPHDIFQKNSHVIQLVTGLKSVAEENSSRTQTLLQISGMEDVSISSLSDDNFSEEECNDLRNRVKDGLLKQPTVGELEQKVKDLHEDITKHWLAKELVLLNNLIDRANEKGWRYQVMEHLKKRKLLQTPSEQSRLLSEIPKVMSEQVSGDTVFENSPEATNQEPEDSPEVATNKKADDLPKDNNWDWEACYDSPSKEAMINFSMVPDNQGVHLSRVLDNQGVHLSRVPDNQGVHLSRVPDNQATEKPQFIAVEKVEVPKRSNGHYAQLLPIEDKGSQLETKATIPATNIRAKPFQPRKRESEPVSAEPNVNSKPSIVPDHIDILRNKTVQTSNGRIEPPIFSPREDSQNRQVVVIDLSDDDDADEPPKAPRNEQPRITTPNILDQLLWYYLDPQHQTQGPFSLRSMKRWKDHNFFPNNFRVWQLGQTPQESVLLTDLFRPFFPI